MTSKLPDGFWTAALKVGGLATVGLFVLWSLYRQILEKVGLSQLGEVNSFRFLVLLTVLIFVASIVAMVIWLLRHRGAGDANRQIETIQPGSMTDAGSSVQSGTPVEFDIPQNWTFQQVLTALASDAGCAIDFQGFNKAELNAVVRSQKLQTRTMRAALERVGKLAQSPIRPYRVTKRDGLFQLKTEGGDR